METYAFAHKAHPTRVTLWCEVSESGRSFWIINGLWRMYLAEAEAEYVLAWEGEVPPHSSQHFTDAIIWIQEQVDGDHEH